MSPRSGLRRFSAPAQPMVNQFLTAFGDRMLFRDRSMEELMFVRNLGQAHARTGGCRKPGAGRSAADRRGPGRCRLRATGSPASARPPRRAAFPRRHFDRAFRDVTDPDPEVLEKARTQAEFKAPAWDYFDNRVQEQSIANGRAMAQKWKPLARPHREALRRRPLHPARHLVDGIELRRYLQGQEDNAQRRALAGDPWLCRQEARQIRAHPADRGAEDPADAATSTRAI